MEKNETDYIRPPNTIKPELLKAISMPTVSKAQSGGGDSSKNSNDKNTNSEKDSEDPGALSSNSVNNSALPSNFTLSPFAKEFVPRQFQPFKEAPSEAAQSNNDTMQAVRNFLKEVNYNPARFQYQADNLSRVLNHVTDHRSLVDYLFEEAIRDSNARYSAAKLLDVLIIKLDTGNQLRENVINKCKGMLEEASIYKEEDLRGLGMFLAELYSQIMHSNGSRIDTLKDGIVYLCNKIIENPSGENIKCVSKIIKLVGIYATDTGSPVELNELVDQLVILAQEPHHTRDVRDLAQSVRKLKDSNWGKSLSPTPVDSLEPAFDSLVLDEPVYYGPDGQPFTAEERLFLQNNLPSEFDNDDGDNCYEDDMLDDEMAQAYEDFLRETEEKVLPRLLSPLPIP